MTDGRDAGSSAKISRERQSFHPRSRGNKTDSDQDNKPDHGGQYNRSPKSINLYARYRVKPRE